MPHTRTRLALAASLATAALLLSGCSLLGNLVSTNNEPKRDATGQVTEPAQDADVFSVKVGDCLNSTEAEAEEDADVLQEVPIVPCDQPHEDEVYFAYDLDDGDYPGQDAVLDDANTTCSEAFSMFIGVAYDQSTLDFWPMYPTTESWDAGDREILCVAWDPSGEKVTGTLSGAAR